jgi:hypothetical protein
LSRKRIISSYFTENVDFVNKIIIRNDGFDDLDLNNFDSKMCSLGLKKILLRIISEYFGDNRNLVI